MASVSISDMLADAGRHFDDYFAFLISSLVIGAHWRLHHRMFRYVRVPTTAIIRHSMYWLLRLRGGLWQSIAMALGLPFPSRPYLVIGQAAFAVWAAVPITANLIQPFFRGPRAKVAA